MTIANKLALLEQTKEAQRVKLGLPKSMPFSQYIKFMRAWTPDELFANGEQGVWLDPSDLSTMFQDVNGTEPVTKDGDPVGLILDKSQGGEIDYLYNKPTAINSLDGWYSREDKSLDASATITEQGLQVDIGPPFAFIARDIKLVEGVTYYFHAETTITLPLLRLFSETGSILYTNPRINSQKQAGYYKALKTETVRLRVQKYDYNNPLKGVLKSLVVKPVAGNHATQPTAASRPVYRTDSNAHGLEFDGVDDILSVQLPSGTYTEIKASRDGVTHKHPVNVSDTYTFGDLSQAKQSVSGLVLVNRQLTQAEIENVTNLMKVKAGITL